MYMIYSAWNELYHISMYYFFVYYSIILLHYLMYYPHKVWISNLMKREHVPRDPYVSSASRPISLSPHLDVSSSLYALHSPNSQAYKPFTCVGTHAARDADGPPSQESKATQMHKRKANKIKKKQNLVGVFAVSESVFYCADVVCVGKVTQRICLARRPVHLIRVQYLQHPRR